MERIIILKNTVTGQELTMPVTPSSYPMGHGRAVERLDMAVTGQIALPGLKGLFQEVLEVMLPARDYPFCTAGAVTNPKYYLELLSLWSDEANVCRYIVSGTGINAPVLLGPLEYGEQDGSNDVYLKIPLYEYRYLDEVLVEQTQNNSRPTENNEQKATADSYTVKKGDTLWDISRRIYGDSCLAYKLATANGIKNPDLIFPDQVLTLPELSKLKDMPDTPAPGTKSAGFKTKTENTEDLTAETVTETLADVRIQLKLPTLGQRFIDELTQELGVKQ